MIDYKSGKKHSIDQDNRSMLKQFFGGPDRIWTGGLPIISRVLQPG